MFVLFSAFENDTDIIPVKLEIKEFSDKPNRLYVAVALEGIKKDRVVSMGVPNTRSHVRTSPVNISIADLFSEINPKDIDLLKYIPDEFLTEEQIAAKTKFLFNKDIQRETLQQHITYNRDELLAKSQIKGDTAERAGGVENNSSLSPTDNISKNIISNNEQNVNNEVKANVRQNQIKGETDYAKETGSESGGESQQLTRSVDSSEQSATVLTRTGKTQGRYQTSESTGKSIRNKVDSLGTEKVSTASLGISKGTSEKTLKVVPRSIYRQKKNPKLAEC